MLITFTINSKNKTITDLYKRNFRNYLKEIFCNMLRMFNWSIETNNVQTFWNCSVSELVEVVDRIVPTEKIGHNRPSKRHKRPKQNQ